MQCVKSGSRNVEVGGEDALFETWAASGLFLALATPAIGVLAAALAALNCPIQHLSSTIYSTATPLSWS